MFNRKERPFRCPIQFFNEPTLTGGSSGCGKTNKHRYWILQLAPLVTGMWLFDFRKREFGMLKPYLRSIGVDLIVMPARQMRLNPLQVPPYCDPRNYAPNLADTLVRILKLPQRAAKLLLVTILALYLHFGVLAGAKVYPSILDLYKAVAANTHAHPESRHAIIASLEPLLLSLGDVLQYRVGWTTNDLANRKIAFDFSGTSDTETDLLLNTLLFGEFMSRIARGISNPNMNLWICCDEAARLCGSGDSSLSEWIGLIRGTGIGIDLSVQSADLARPNYVAFYSMVDDG